MGDEAFDNYKAGSVKPKIGDAVLFKRYAGVSIRHKDKELNKEVFYRMIRDDEILAVIPEGTEDDIIIKFFTDYLAQNPNT